MKRTSLILIGAALAGAVVSVGGGMAIGVTADEDTPAETETPITGEALERASSAALEIVGQGTVTDTEFGDEESLYEVEVTLPDGRQVDVQLDVALDLVDQIPDGESGE